MKSPEQMGEEGPRETTPEEAEALTRKRREEAGLGEARELLPDEVRELNEAIEGLLGRLDQYDFDSFGPEIQGEWYAVEHEAENGKDRELAKATLERFLAVLEDEAKKREE